MFREQPRQHVGRATRREGNNHDADHYFLIAAHRRAPASVLSPFIYTQLIWVVIFGYPVFDHVPNGWTVAGACMVIGSGLYLLARWVILDRCGWPRFQFQSTCSRGRIPS